MLTTEAPMKLPFIHSTGTEPSQLTCAVVGKLSASGKITTTPTHRRMSFVIALNWSGSSSGILKKSVWYRGMHRFVPKLILMLGNVVLVWIAFNAWPSCVRNDDEVRKLNTV